MKRGYSILDEEMIKKHMQVEDCPKGVNELILACIKYTQKDRRTWDGILEDLRKIEDPYKWKKEILPILGEELTSGGLKDVGYVDPTPYKTQTNEEVPYSQHKNEEDSNGPSQSVTQQR